MARKHRQSHRYSSQALEDTALSLASSVATGLDRDKRNAFTCAIRTGNLEIVRAAVAADAGWPSAVEQFCPDKDGWTPLHWAAAKGYEATLEGPEADLLIFQTVLGACPSELWHMEDNLGFTAGEQAVKQNRPQIFELIGESPEGPYEVRMRNRQYMIYAQSIEAARQRS